jgi:gluconolactonase
MPHQEQAAGDKNAQTSLPTIGGCTLTARSSWADAPQALEAELFSSMPAEFRRRRSTRWADINAGGRQIDSFLEGPSFDREGLLYVTDIPNGRVFTIDATGRWSLVAEYDGWPNGLKIDRQGRIHIADYRRGILTLDPRTGRVEPLVETWRSEGFKGVNDLCFASNGDLYFTDQGQTGLHDPSGRVFRWNEAAGLTCLIDNAPSPNGLCLNVDETQLYVAMTRANGVWRVPLYLQMSGGAAGPDGLALDAEGGLAVAHPGTTAWRFDRLGRPTHCVDYAEDLFITNLAYGGDEHRDLYLIESHRGEVLRVSMPVPGHPMHSHAQPPAAVPAPQTIEGNSP